MTFRHGAAGITQPLLHSLCSMHCLVFECSQLRRLRMCTQGELLTCCRQVWVVLVCSQLHLHDGVLWLRDECGP